MAAVITRGLRRSFGDREILRSIDLELAPDEFVALLGRSGSGKSTLLRILAGLDRGAQGEIWVPERRAVVFQDARLLPWRSVLDNVILGQNGRDAREAGRRALTEVGLADHRDVWPKTLSGGEAQRVALARALVRDPALLLLDEPFGALDALTRLKMHALVKELCERHRPAVLLVTHDVDEAIRLADRVLVLGDGVLSLDVRTADHTEEALRQRLLDELGVQLGFGHVPAPDVPLDPDFRPQPRPRLRPCPREGAPAVTATIAPTADATEPLPFEVVPLSGTIGAEIRGVDLRRDLDERTVAAVRGVWLDRKVVFFPGQHLTPEEHLAFAARFGDPTEGHPVIPGLDGHPQVFEIDYSAPRELYANYGDVSRRTRGLDWHTDVTFVARPPLGSILRAVVAPPAGGDTLFSDQQAAYDGLSDALKGFLGDLTATHDGRAAFQGVLDQVGEGAWEGEAFTRLEPVVHPVVRTHPETGRKGLFVNPGFTSHINELSRAESDTLLDFLYAHSVRPEYVVRRHWAAGDIGFWDNRATQHSVVGDYGDQHRVIQRVTLQGDVPV